VSTIVDNLSPIGGTPWSESVARELVGLEPDQQGDAPVWPRPHSFTASLNWITTLGAALSRRAATEPDTLES
jgi:hypothetical protein